MGCYIHLFAEKRDADGTWQHVETGDALTHQSYSVFGFLANVRNYSRVEPISQPRGLPEDASVEAASAFERWSSDAHTPSWLSLEELLAFDYTAYCEDRRALRQIAPNALDGSATAAKGTLQSYRDFLGEWFFEDLRKLKDAGAGRIVFWFDN
jgi:hypothetical protein